MKCRKCEYELEKDWKYCPKCKAKRTSYALIILSIVVSVLVAYSLVAEIIFPFAFHEQYAKKYLENKYNKAFEKVEFVKKIPYPDSVDGCDGTMITTSKGIGSYYFYLVYSKEDDLEFEAYYYPHEKEHKDNYEERSAFRERILKTYSDLEEMFSDYTKKINFTFGGKTFEITSLEEMGKVVSKIYCSSKEIGNYVQIDMEFEMDALDLYYKEYNNIKKLHRVMPRLLNKFVIFGSEESKIDVIAYHD